MHEMGLVRHVVRTVERYAAENNLSHVDGLVLEIGELSLVMPEYIKKIYPVVIEGTILEGSELEMQIIPGMAECNECDEIFNVVENKGYCPNCRSFDKQILTGKDFKIKELHIKEDKE